MDVERIPRFKEMFMSGRLFKYLVSNIKSGMEVLYKVNEIKKLVIIHLSGCIFYRSKASVCGIVVANDIKVSQKDASIAGVHFHTTSNATHMREHFIGKIIYVFV